MEKRDLGAMCAAARSAIDQTQAGGFGGGQRRGDVVHRVSRVVQARSSLGNELGHRRLGVGRFEQLPTQSFRSVAQAIERHAYPLFFDDFFAVESGAKNLFVVRACGIEARHGDAKMIQAKNTERSREHVQRCHTVLMCA